ncbi:glycerol-3-phosphate 1-O-acyltransferase PlsY [Aquabacter spiritensis]|uniref:Glycerol-3-phosphate acyltransferase n=1 Tax=Aquabacter spiritensis TaxID=933073 RepID=A0A4R3LQN1_9HYPH|nr:glycerol-3-phosphate 1-O-acyltransferase PlsY [Aquabacter spiritensis]TCT02864.1 acyl-phosphate glycerol-3-phosphate acyltransferase [Aquabacter spiritensis]
MTSLSWSLSLPLALAALAVGYLFGAIPFGILVTRMAGTADLRSIGSGNIGATNVLRTGRKDLAALTLLGDALKGTAAVLIARAALGEEAALAAALGAFCGHLWPVWLGFRGGKGVATFLGVTLALLWPAGIAFALVWLAIAAATKYSSLAALAASLATCLAAAALGATPTALLLAVLTALLWLKHRENIGRLIAGTESRIGGKGGPKAGGPAA